MHLEDMLFLKIAMTNSLVNFRLEQMTEGTAYLAEARTMLEVFRRINTLDILSEGKISIIMDNKRLQRILTNDKHNHTDMTQDTGAVIKEIIEVKNQLTFLIDILHVSRNDHHHNFFLQPAIYLINFCGEFSKVQHIEIENSNIIISLPDNQHTIMKSVNEYIREQDAEEIL